MAPTLLEGHRGYFVHTATVALCFSNRIMSQDSKKFIRTQAKKFRQDIFDTLSLDELQALEIKAFELFLSHFSPFQHIALYSSFRDEFPTHEFMRLCWQQNKKTYLPRMSADTKILQFFSVEEQTWLQKNPFGFLEPQPTQADTKFDIIFVPLLAFDQRGARLGYGGGYYDATIDTLKSQNPNLIVCGLAFAEQAVLLPLPHEPHDLWLDYVLTPTKLFDFRHKRP
jgi:5-formyltetrahydrofolate cyclo-ligase